MLADIECATLIQSINLSRNSGIEDEELALLTKTLVKLTQKGKLSALHSLNIGSIGASPSSLAIFIKALPQITPLKTLDMSGNAIPFFCVDHLITALRKILDASQTTNKKEKKLCEEENQE